MNIFKDNTPVQGFITPGNVDVNEWATHDAKFGSGGLQVVENDSERNGISAERRIGKVIYNKETKQFNIWDENKSDWTLLDLTLQTSHNASYLAYMLNDGSIAWSKDVNKGVSNSYLWFDNIVYENISTFIQPDKGRKTIVLTEGEYYMGFRIYSDSYVAQDGAVTISIVNSYDNDNVLNDINGKPLTLSKNLKKDEKVGALFVDGVIKIDSLTHLRLKVTTNCCELKIKDRNSGASGMIIQELRSNEETSPAFLQWIVDTGINPIITYYNFDKEFIKVGVDKVDLTSTGTQNVFKGFFQEDLSGEFFNAKSDCHIVIGDDGESFKVKDSTGFEYGVFVNNDTTKLLRKRALKIWVEALPHYKFGDFWFIVAYWNGAPNKYVTEIVESISDTGAITYKSGWNELGKIDFKQKNITDEYYDKKPFSAYLLETIPQGANNLVAFLVPKTNTPTNIDINYIRFDASSPFAAYSIEYSEIYNYNGFVSETLNTNLISKIKEFKSPLKSTFTDLYDLTWFNNNISTVNESSILKTSDKKGWQFWEEGNVLVNLSFKAITNIDDHVSNIDFKAVLQDSSGQNARDIKGSVRRFVLPRTANTPAICEVTFPIKVSYGEVLKFYVKTEKDDECKLVYEDLGEDHKGNVLNVNLIYIDKTKNYYK